MKWETKIICWTIVFSPICWWIICFIIIKKNVFNIFIVVNFFRFGQNWTSELLPDHVIKATQAPPLVVGISNFLANETHQKTSVVFQFLDSCVCLISEGSSAKRCESRGPIVTLEFWPWRAGTFATPTATDTTASAAAASYELILNQSNFF